MLTIITGKSASGKDSIKNALLKDGYINICSNTTRPMRKNEKDGVEYNFLSEEEWKKQEYIESYIYSTKDDFGNPIDYYYGTPITKLDDNKEYVCIKDKDGALALRNYYGTNDTLIVYVDVPDNIRKDRASSRPNFKEDDWEIRTARDNKQFEDTSYADIVLDGTKDFIEELNCLKKNIKSFERIMEMYRDTEECIEKD